jgi:hypothetical protein
MAHITRPHEVCPICGFDPEQLSPGDAVVAVRSFPRRWRRLFTAVLEQEDNGEALLHTPLGGGSSSAERLHRVTVVFHGTVRQLDELWSQDDPALDEVGEDGLDRATATPVSTLLDDLVAVAGRLAGAIERYRGEQWGRSGHRRGDQVTALDLAREAIHQASHDLRVCREDLARVCAHEIDDAR